MKLNTFQIITAVTAFFIVMILNEYVSVILQKLRFLSDSTETDNSPQRLPVSGGIMPAAASFTAAAAGYAVMKYSSESLNSNTLSHGLFFAGQIIILLSFACGFYSDLLRSRGKKGGMSKSTENISVAMLCICFLILKYIIAPDERLLKIPFVGERSTGIYYFPICFIVMIITAHCVSYSSEKHSGTAMSAVIFSGAASVFSVIGANDLGLFYSAAAGAAMAFFFLNYPGINILPGKSGALFAGMTAAVAAVSSKMTIYILIMLLPFFFLRVRGCLPKKENYKNIKMNYEKREALKTAACFASAAVCVLAAYELQILGV